MATAKQNRWITVCASIMLSACSTTKISPGSIPEQGLTVNQLYQQSIQQSLPQPRYQSLSVSPTQDGFKALPNPEVPIHVFAHVMQLGDEQIIKPDYTTRFFLYKQNQYALASELY